MSETLIKRASKWVGNIPIGWRLTPLKYVCTYNDETLSDNTDPTFEFDYIDISSVNSTDEITSTERLNFADAPSRARRVVRADDIIMSTVRTYLRAVAIIPESKNQLIASTGFLVIRALQEAITPEYLGYVIKSDSFISAIEAESVGVSYPAINASEAVKNYIPVPPLDVQRSIVAFLDSRCKPINEAISRHRMIIDKLEDYRKTVITKAVTKGLDENVPMKDSGIEWIGQIPEKWRISRIKFIAKLASGGTPSREHGEYWGGGIPWVKTGELNDGYIENIEESITEEGLMNSSAKVFPKDTLLMAMYGQGKTRGTTGCLTRESAINQACIAFTNLCDVMKDYLWMALRAIYTPIREAAVGSGQPNLSASLIANFSIPIPSYAEQADIATYLNYKCAAIDEGVDRQEQVIARLEEYRRSLIFHAVTGRIDCTGGAR